MLDFFCGALITILCVKVYTPEREDVQGNSPYHFRPASYQRGLLTSNGQTFCLMGQHLLHPGRAGRNNTALFSPSDEGSSKEEPSSTVEEVESKSFTEPNSEELDEGEYHQGDETQASVASITTLRHLTGLDLTGFLCGGFQGRRPPPGLRQHRRTRKHRQKVRR